MDNRPKTIFCDLDGTLIKHVPPVVSQKTSFEMELLEGTLEKLSEWDKKGYNIIIITGRREGSREITKKQLQKVGIIYDKLIMGIGGGTRFLINDNKLNDTMDTAIAICTRRNEGIKNIII